MSAPRLLLCAPASGGGKTTVTCALLQALVNRGAGPVAFKCGPDYIDPMFHSEIIGAKSRNLDLFFLGRDTARYLLEKNSRGSGLALIEGVMGYYDGIGLSADASAYDLARATGTPAVLVLDEPAAGLDPEGREMILSQVKRFHKETGTTVILVSHSMEDIAKYADKVLVMDQRRIAMYDTVEHVFARADELLELGLSVPQVTKVFLRLRAMGLDLPQDVYTVPYAVKTIQAALAKKNGGGEATC